MFKTFFFGILLGAVAAAGALYAFPAVDQHREASIVSVTANGGNAESFHINIPEDRLMLGAAAQSSPLPIGSKWPGDEILSSVRVELFKVRNARDTVIGVAARTSARQPDANNIEWVIHLPARGSIFVHMDSAVQAEGFRLGEFRTGSREFSTLQGTLSERWIADKSGDEDAPLGRIELQAMYVGRAEPVE